MHPTLSFLQGNMYLVVGEDDAVQGDMYVYDHRVDAWFSGPELPMSVSMHTAVSMGNANLLLALGGKSRVTGTTNAICSYDPRQRAWTVNPSNCNLPLRTDGVSAAAVDDHTVLALAGRSLTINPAEGPPLLTPPLLDIRMWQWQPCPAALPESYSLRRELATAVTFQGKVVVVGGIVQFMETLSSDVLAYSAEGQGRWEMLPNRCQWA